MAFAAVLAVGIAAPGASRVAPARADDPVPLRHLTMAFSGDDIPLPALYNKAARNAGGHGYDFRPMLADIAPLVSSADLAVCHLEIPVAPPGTKPTGPPRWSTPPEIVPALVGAGYDRCSVASNHTLDRGVAGINATIDAFDAAGLGHSGTAETPADAIAPIFEVNGVKIAHLAYTFGFNGARLPAGEKWRANLIDPARIIADATDARARGAELVVVSLHWGVETAVRPTRAQRQLAHTLLSSGTIDLIVGSHSHVPQPIEQVDGHWVVWSMGNSLSNHRPETGWPAASEDGVIVTFSVTENPGGGFSIAPPVVHPTWSRPSTYVVMDSLAHAHDTSLDPATLRRLNRSLARMRKLVGQFFPT